MFGSKKTTAQNKKSAGVSSSTAVPTGTNNIVHGTNIQGSINANTDIRLDGTMTGDLTCTGKVIIGSEGRFEGEIKCVNAVIEGYFNGKLNASNSLEVKSNAVVSGDIDAENLSVEGGAKFNVTCSTAVKHTTTRTTEQAKAS